MDAGSITTAGGWILFWMQFPLIVLAAAVPLIGLVAIWRARPEDIPAVFAAFTAAFAPAFRRPDLKVPPSRRDRSATPQAESENH
ncbi:hypothetical protein ACWFRF_28950 [Nocardia sp. NPDC055165]